MKIADILTEKINLGSNFTSISQSLADAVDYALRLSSKQQQLEYIESVLTDHAIRIVESETGNTQYSSQVEVSVSYIHGHGVTYDLSVTISAPLVLDLIKNRDDRNQFKQLLNQIVNILVHELVHVIQHIRQLQAGRKEYEFRSYAGSTDDLVDEINSGRGGKLYFSRPQEIAAFAHNAGIQVMQAMKRQPGPKNIPQLITTELKKIIEPDIFDSLPDQVKKRYYKKTAEEVFSIVAKRTSDGLPDKLRQTLYDTLNTEASSYLNNVVEYIKQHSGKSVDSMLLKRANHKRMVSYKMVQRMFNKFDTESEPIDANSITMYEIIDQHIEFELEMHHELTDDSISEIYDNVSSQIPRIVNDQVRLLNPRVQTLIKKWYRGYAKQ